MDYYPKINITMLLYPYYNDYTPAQNKSIEIVLMCMNYGLKIESRASSNLVSYQNKEGKATISLLDYFDGFNCNFQVSTENVNSNIYSLSQDISYNYLLESVSSTQNVIFTVEYTNFILVFFSQLGKLQVYSLQDSAENIKKIDKEYDYNELFYNCSIDFIHYSYIEWSEDSFFILSCKNYIGKITETYLYKVFHIDNISEDSIDLTMVFQAYSSYKIKRAALSEYKNQELRQYSLVMISEKDTQSDNSLIFINFVCDTSFDCNIIKIKSANGNTYNYDSFIVNSLIFYIETEFIIVAINNFGLVVISCITQDVILQIPIYDSYFDIPPRNMDIYTLIPLGTFGVRVLLNNEGGFSFFWNHVDENKLEIFWDFYVLDRYENINREVATNLFVPLKAGYAQVIKIPISYDNFEYYLRIYISFNHDKSKNFKEFLIDKIDNCDTIDYITHYDDKEIGIILVCGYQLIIYYIDIIPELIINRQVKLNITASNYFSNQTITFDIDKNEIGCDYSNASGAQANTCVSTPFSVILVLFLFIVIVLAVIVLVVLKKIMNMKTKEEKASESVLRLSKKHSISNMRRSEEVKIDRLSYEPGLKKFESVLETLKEEDSEREDNQIESNIRNSLNYKIQQNTDSFVTNSSVNRDSVFSKMIRNSYNRSSTRSYYESLNKKQEMGFNNKTNQLINELRDSQDKDENKENGYSSEIKEPNPKSDEREIFEFLPKEDKSNSIYSYKLEKSMNSNE